MNLGYLYNSLSAALLYEALVLGFWNFIQWRNIYCRCATSKFQSDRRKKMPKLRGSELRWIRDILGYSYNTLSAALLYEAFVLGLWNFIMWKNIYCRCATLRFQSDRPKITGFELDELGISQKISHIKKPTLKYKQNGLNINKFSFTNLPIKTCLLGGGSCLTEVKSNLFSA